jgi:hypothetical protein
VKLDHTVPKRATDADKRLQQIEAEQVDLLCAQTRTALIASTLNVGLVVLVLWHVTAHTRLLMWAAATGVWVACRLLFLRWYRQTVLTASQIHTWRTRLIISAGISGCSWGAAAVFLFPHYSPVHQVFIAFVLGGMAVGAAATLSPVLEAY